MTGHIAASGPHSTTLHPATVPTLRLDLTGFQTYTAIDKIFGSPTPSFPPLLFVGPQSNQCQATNLDVTLASSLSLTLYIVLAPSSQTMS